jgi:hypothetical protein
MSSVCVARFQVSPVKLGGAKHCSFIRRRENLGNGFQHALLRSAGSLRRRSCCFSGCQLKPRRTWNIFQVGKALAQPIWITSKPEKRKAAKVNSPDARIWDVEQLLEEGDKGSEPTDKPFLVYEIPAAAPDLYPAGKLPELKAEQAWTLAISSTVLIIFLSLGQNL